MSHPCTEPEPLSQSIGTLGKQGSHSDHRKGFRGPMLTESLLTSLIELEQFQKRSEVICSHEIPGIQDSRANRKQG